MNAGSAEDDSSFLELSADLTGFSRFELQATGLTNCYFSKVEGGISQGIRERLYTAWRDGVRTLPAEQKPDALASIVMAVPELRDAARKIIALWYVGSWYWSPNDPAVVSATAYVEGLMWRAIASHPMGASPQGYGAWAQPAPRPPEVTDAV